MGMRMQSQMSGQSPGPCPVWVTVAAGPQPQCSDVLLHLLRSWGIGLEIPTSSCARFSKDFSSIPTHPGVRPSLGKRHSTALLRHGSRAKAWAWLLLRASYGP